MASLLDVIAAPIKRWLFSDPLIASSAGGRTTLEAREMYDARNALSAIDAFPWVRACVTVISTDLAGVPLVAVRTDPRNGKREILQDHPTLRAINEGGTAMRMQWYADQSLTGEAYIRQISEPGAADFGVSRLHPDDVTPNIDQATGEIVDWKWGNRRLAFDEVLMVRGINWERGVRASRGTSPIRSLEQGLMASKDARKFARKSAQQGRVEYIVTPSDPLAQFGKTGVDAIKERINEGRQDGTGTLVLNKALNITPVSLTSREMEFGELDERVMYEVLSVFGVPPVRVGLPGANYGTARSQNRDSWERRRHEARLFDDQFSRLTGDPNVRIEHDFRDVEALQTSRTERLGRVMQHIANGMSPDKAYAFEGFHDAPVDASTKPINMRPPQVPSEVNEPQEDNGEGRGLGQAFGAFGRAVESWQAGAAARYQERALVGELEDADQILERGILAAEMMRAGVEYAAALELATLGASMAHDAVSTIVDTSGSDGVLGVRALRCFGPEFARMLTTHHRAA